LLAKSLRWAEIAAADDDEGDGEDDEDQKQYCIMPLPFFACNKQDRSMEPRGCCSRLNRDEANGAFIVVVFAAARKQQRARDMARIGSLFLLAVVKQQERWSLDGAAVAAAMW
jgi:hypothetical protein